MPKQKPEEQQQAQLNNQEQKALDAMMAQFQGFEFIFEATELPSPYDDMVHVALNRHSVLLSPDIVVFLYNMFHQYITLWSEQAKCDA